MRKIVLIVALTISLANISFATDLYPRTYEGTYIPILFKEILETSESYYQAINETRNSRYYDVLCLINNEIMSNLDFHDSFQLDDNEINFKYVEEKNCYYIIDNQTSVKYIKISDSTDYYSAYKQYLYNTILAKNIPDGFMEIKLNETGFELYGNIWEIDLDQYHYGDDVSLIFYNTSCNGEYLGLVKGIKTSDFFRMKDGEIMSQILDRKIKKYIYSSYDEYSSYLVSNYEKGDTFYDEIQYNAAVSSYQEVIDAFEYTKYLKQPYKFIEKNNDAANLKLYYFSIYNIACCYSLLREYSQARLYLLNAVKAGYPHLDHMKNDKDLKKMYEIYPSLEKDIFKEFNKNSN